MARGSLGTMQLDELDESTPENRPHDDDVANQTPAGISKRPKACHACRLLKVRCIYDPNNTNAPCLRCKKSGRNCVEQPPPRPRKPRKKTVSRVLELEKKIDLLRASLGSKGDDTGHANASIRDAGTRDAGTRDMSLSAQPERGSAEIDSASPSTLESPRGLSRIDHERGHEDVVKRGLISPDKADELLERYNTQMVQHMPAVVFQPDLTAGALRRRKPVLFLAVMAAAAHAEPDLQRQLFGELTSVLAEKIMGRAEKSLELVQALQVAAIWCWLPDHYHELQYYQLMNTSITMAIDIGLGHRLPERKAIPYSFHAFGQTCYPNMSDPTTLESRTAWLVCYYLALNTALIMRRPLVLRWTRFMGESLKVLKVSADRAPTDEYLCALVWAYRIAEKAVSHYSFDSPDDPTDGPRTVYILRKLDDDLKSFRASLSNDLLQGSLQMLLGVLPLYIYGPALYSDSADNRQNEPQPTAPSRAFSGVVMADSVALTTANVGVIAGCLSNISMVVDSFLSMDVDAVRSMASFNYVRPIFAVTMLVRIYLSISEDPELLNTIKRSELRVESCIDALVHHFCAAAAEGRCRPTAKFAVVLHMLKNCFITKKAQLNDMQVDAVSAPGAQETCQCRKTPLHLLCQASASQSNRDQVPPGDNLAVPCPQNYIQRPAEMLEPISQATCSSAGPLPPSNVGDPSAFNNNFLSGLSVEDYALSLGLGFAGDPMNPFYMDLGPDYDAMAAPQNAGLRGFGQGAGVPSNGPRRGNEPSDSWGGMPSF